MGNPIIATCVWLSIIALTVPPVFAQRPASSDSFEELRSNQTISEGDEIQLVERDGGIINGRVESIGGNSLTVLAGRNRREISQASVQEIRLQRSDSNWNGGLIGLGAGLLAGIVGLAASCPDDRECAGNVELLIVPAFAAGGAIVGEVVDSSIHGYDTVYKAPTQARSGRLTITPVVSVQQQGIRVGFSF